MQTLKNDVLTVQVAEHGAELQSIKKGTTEYLWQGDPAYWGRRSPVLFPIVGSVWEKRYRVDGVEYELGQHGFARDMEFTLVSETETEVRYRLVSTEETLKKYPYQFVLEIAYRLHGNSLDVIWEVTNPDADKVMYFQIGAHPAFIYPDYSKESRERGFLVFDRTEDLQCIRIKEKGCVDADTLYPLEVGENGLLELSRETFDEIDTIMLQDSQVSKVTLHRNDGTPWLTLTFDAPVIGIWSPPTKNAPFICMEPWYGRCDRVGFAGDYRDRDWVNRLGSGQTFSTAYTITLH
jgi:galactose mutarotase-like enzyme